MMAHRIGETRLAVDSLKASLAGRQFVERVHDRFFGFWVNGVNLPDYLFMVLVESGDRAGALDFARSQGWTREGHQYCPDLGSDDLPDLTPALLGMLTMPESSPCLLTEGTLLIHDGMARLARLVLMEVVHTSPYGSIRQLAEVQLRHLLPSHDVAKRAEWLLIVGNRLDQLKKSDE